MSRPHFPGRVHSVEACGDQVDASSVLLCGRPHRSAAGSVPSLGEGNVHLFAEHPTNRLGRTGDSQDVGECRRRLVRPFDSTAATQVVVGHQGKVRLNLSDREFSWDDEELVTEVYGCGDGRN